LEDAPQGYSLPTQMLSLSELMPDDSELSLLLQDSRPNPEAHLSQSEQSQRLQATVLTVPPQYRLVLVLHDMEDLDTEQIAQVLGIKPGTVRVRLHRARLYVRRELAATEKRNRPAEAIGQISPRRSHKSAQARVRSQECREIFANLSEYLDGRIESTECDQMRRHIEACGPCVAFIQDLQQAIDRCRNADSPCAPEMGQRLRSLLTQEYLRMMGLPPAEKTSSPL